MGLRFSGRIPRLKYWLGQVGVIVLFNVTSSAARLISSNLRSTPEAPATPAMLGAALAALALVLAVLCVGFWIGLALVVKRWHDRDKSATWALLGFVPIVGWLWQGIECGFLDGTLGPNRYGPSPKNIVGVIYGETIAETFS